MNPEDGTVGFAGQEHARLEAELAELRRRRERMRAERAEDPESVGDRGDAADALQRGEDLAGIEEQIGRLSWILAGGNADVEGQLPNGTLVTLRFPDDDDDVRMRVVNYIEQTPAGAEDTTLTADSPLGLALVGRKSGDRITYQTSRGELRVALLSIELP